MKPHESLGHAFGAMSRMVDRELRVVFAEYGVQPGQLPVLLALYEHDGQTQAELAAGVVGGGAVAAVRAAGAVARQPAPSLRGGLAALLRRLALRGLALLRR